MMPAITAAPGRRMPTKITTASQNSPAWVVAVNGVTLPMKVAKNTPPNPANSADRANTASLVRTIECPEVAAAGSELRTAMMARPVTERWRFLTNQPAANTRITNSTARDFSSWKSNGPSWGRGMSHPLVPWPFLNQLHSNSTRSLMKASARVARAKGKPPNRKAGRATMTPSTPAITTPTISAGMNGSPVLSKIRPAVMAAMVTKAAWARLTMPPRPVSSTQDMNTRPKAKPVTHSPNQN